MHVPYAQAGHVCKLSALSALCITMREKETDPMAALLPVPDLPEQLLLCCRGFRRHRLVLVPPGRKLVLERRLFEKIYPLRSDRNRAVRSTAAPHRARHPGTRQRRISAHLPVIP